MMKEMPKDEVAVVVDNTGRVQAQFVGIFAKDEASQFLRTCRSGRNKVDHLSDASIIMGTKAAKALETGRA